MNVITALNRKYIPYTLVMLTSLGINSKESVDAYLLHSELTGEDEKLLKGALEEHGVNIHLVAIDRSMFSDKLPRNEQWSLETYFRLMMFDVLPDNISRALYLDGDMVINKDLTDLYNMDFADKEIIACDDKGGFNQKEGYGTKHNEMFREAYEHGYRYFNAGVMLLNLELMRKRYSFKTYLDAFEAWDYQMEAPDQDILNWVHWKNVDYVDFAYYDLFARVAHTSGITYEEVKKDVAIVHFPGAKPWENANYHFGIEKLWWDYAKKTPIYQELLESFVESAVTDNSIELFMRNLDEKNRTQADLLQQLMAKVKEIM